MKKKIKEKWLAALRSGKYKQCKNSLKDGNSFCCLGVLTDLYIKEHPGNSWDNIKDVCNLVPQEVLPKKVMKWAELNSGDPELIEDNLASSCSEVNDEGLTFIEIANLIEQQL